MTKPVKWQLTIVVGLIAFMALTSQAQPQETTQPMQLSLTTMRAMLFFENTGKFSPDVFTNEVVLWNTPIEGSSREGASESMLVVVEVKAAGPGFYPQARKVQLTARYRIADVSGRGKPAFFSKIMRISIGSDDKFFAGFWLYETGCHPVELTALIVGQKGTLRKTINLRCGE